MINRVLIRIKVVQLLYSYLLIENHFMLESQPSAPTKEKRFAYNLYLDLLMLMVRIAATVTKRGGYRPLEDTRFIKKILADETIKSLQNKYRIEDFPFAGIVDLLADKITESGLYKNFIKNQNADNREDDQIWEHLFNIIIMPDPALTAAITKRTNYTLGGVDRMRDIMTETFRNFYASRDNLDDALKTLARSMDKARELYFRLLLLPVELTNLRDEQIEENRNKFVPTSEDLNPNMRFVENALVKAIADNDTVADYAERNSISWRAEDPLLLESLLKDILNSDIYADYMDFPATDLHTDSEFWRNIFRNIILENENFLEFLENQSVFWNDDLDIISTFVIKTIKRFEDSTPGDPVLPMYKDSEDEAFGRQLFSDVVRNKDLYRRLIDDCVKNERWDSERLAVMDVIVVMTAISEIMNFPKIPLSASINEYIEIAKSYSTSKSGAFVNGLLYGITEKLREEKKLFK